jgi:membrane protein
MFHNKQDVLDFGKRLFKKAGEDDIGGGAAELSYRFFLALFPLFIFLAAMGGFVASAMNVANPTQEIMDLIGDSLPDDSASVLETELQGILQEQNVGLLSLGIIGSIFAASAGINTLMKEMNRIMSQEESRGTIQRTALSLVLTVLSAAFLIAAFVTFFVGQVYGPRIADEVGLGNVATTLIGLARWPLAIVLTMLAVAFLYWLAPAKRLPPRWFSPGAVFFAIGWAMATFLFGVYVANFGSYNAVYGTLGGVVVLLIWFYLTAYLLLLGAEINALTAEKQEEEAPGAREREVSDRTTVGV